MVRQGLSERGRLCMLWMRRLRGASGCRLVATMEVSRPLILEIDRATGMAIEKANDLQEKHS